MRVIDHAQSWTTPCRRRLAAAHHRHRTDASVRPLCHVARGGLLALALGIVGCGSDDVQPQTVMSCAEYRQLPDDTREQAIQDAAEQRHIRMLPPGVGGGGLYGYVRVKVDERCQDAELLLDEAMVAASDETTSASLATLTGVPTTATTTTPSRVTPQIAFKPVRTVVWGAKDSGAGSDGNGGERSADWIQSGATVTVTVELGKIAKATPDAVPSAFEQLLTVCAVDSAVDAVIPMRMKLRNTAKIALDLEVAGSLQHPAAYSAPGMTLDAGTQFADGGACQSGGGVNSSHYNWTQQQVAPGDVPSHDWLLVVHNYYPSDYPGGHHVPLSKALGIFNVAAESSDGKLPMDDTTCYSGTRLTGIYPGIRPSFALTSDLSNLANPGVADHLDQLQGVPEC